MRPDRSTLECSHCYTGMSKNSLLLSLLLPISISATNTKLANPLVISWKWDLPLVVVGTGAGLESAWLVAHMPPTNLGTLSKQDIPEYDRWAIRFYSPAVSTLSDISVVAWAAAPMAISLYDNKFKWGQMTPLTTDMLVYFETMLYSSTLDLFVRALRVHPRPFVYNTDAPQSDRLSPEASGSFYSGHADAAFATAVYMSYTYSLRHPDYKGKVYLWTGSLAVAAGISSLRIFSGKHYLSDVVAGAAMGSLFGFVVPWFHRSDESRRKAGVKPSIMNGLSMAMNSDLSGPVFNLEF